MSLRCQLKTPQRQHGVKYANNGNDAHAETHGLFSSPCSSWYWPSLSSLFTVLALPKTMGTLPPLKPPLATPPQALTASSRQTLRRKDRKSTRLNSSHVA